MAEEKQQFETNVLKILEAHPDEAQQWYNALPVELHELVKQAKKRLKNKKDLVVAITAATEGDGKSSLGVTIGFMMNPDTYDLRNNVAYIANSDKVKDQFWKIDSQSTLQIDEAIVSLHKGDFATNVQKVLTKMFMTERYQEKAILLCIPRITDLTESMRNHKVQLWFKILTRGVVVVNVKDRVSDMQDPWWLEAHEKMLKKKFSNKNSAEISTSDYLQLEKKKRTYLCDFRFPALPKCVEKVYERLKREEHSKENDEVEITEESAPEKKWKEVVMNAITHIKSKDKTLSKTKLCEVLGIAAETLNKLLKTNELEYNELSKKQKSIDSPVPQYLQDVISKRYNDIKQPPDTL